MKILYINMDTKSTRDRVTIRGLRENGVEIIEITDNSTGLKKFSEIQKKHKALNNAYDIAIVGYTGGILVPFVRLISRKKIFYNTLSSLFEGMIISRAGRFLSLWTVYYYLIDFLSFHLSHHILVESEAQKKFISKTFFVKKNKISVHFTGVDDTDFFYDSSVQKLPKFTVLFRGKFLPEAGVEVIIKAAKLLENENIYFRIIGNGFLEKKIALIQQTMALNNLETIKDFLPTEILREKMLECHISIGQVSDHPRLLRTIPHKLFESISMNLPYITGRQKPVQEILTDNKTCFFVNPADPEYLAQKILSLKKNTEIMNRVSGDAHLLYRTSLTPIALGHRLLEKLNK